ncbi:MAG: hypothetical protein LBB90_00215 [Tannerella sp.]|jgi:hypothetical protein|nr:hypothetical protein [Tannerella sp.]
MKSCNSTAKEIGVQAKHGHVLHIPYSKDDFFCEGQEKRSEHTEKADKRKIETKSKIHERFSGHFNIFL